MRGLALASLLCGGGGFLKAAEQKGSCGAGYREEGPMEVGACGHPFPVTLFLRMEEEAISSAGEG